MCLAVAGRIIETSGDGLGRTASVEVGGEVREISLAMLPEAGPDAWVTIHAGHALAVLSDAEAAELADLTDEIAEIL
jgi:hydrogenase expression/formation protein HypC